MKHKTLLFFAILVIFNLPSSLMAENIEKIFQIFSFDTHDKKIHINVLHEHPKIGPIKKILINNEIKKNSDLLIEIFDDLPIHTHLYEISDIQNNHFRLIISKHESLLMGVIISPFYPLKVLSEFLTHAASLKIMNEVNQDYNYAIKILSDEYSEQTLTKAEIVEQKVDNVKKILETNIQKSLENAGLLENISEGIKELEEQSKIFKKKAKRLKRIMWYEYIFCCLR